MNLKEKRKRSITRAANKHVGVHSHKAAVQLASVTRRYIVSLECQRTDLLDVLRRTVNGFDVEVKSKLNKTLHSLRCTMRSDGCLDVYSAETVAITRFLLDYWIRNTIDHEMIENKENYNLDNSRPPPSITFYLYEFVGQDVVFPFD
jgi:hypothetical protein